jgi:Domain of unknown function (DUF4129)
MNLRFDVARLAIPICFALSFVAPVGATSPPGSISLEEYISELDRCSATLANSGNDPTALRSLEMSLPREWEVRAGNQQYTVAAHWLRADLARAETARYLDRSAVEQAQREIRSHREAAQALAQSISARNLDQAKGRLNRILAAKEFQAIQGPTWFDSLRARVLDWIMRQVEKLVGKIGHGRAIGNAIAWTLIALSTLLLLLWMVRATTGAGAQPEIDLRGASAVGQDSHYWLREARAAVARGDYRSAIHAGYWAAIARLEETKLLTENRSRTPRESLRLIERERPEYAPLLQLTRRFELVWYGYRSADLADWSDAIEQLEKLGCLRSSMPATSAS